MDSRRLLPAALALVCALSLLSGCETEPTEPLTAPLPSAAISDGANGGNGHFHFLPPLVRHPELTGTFNGALAPSIKICRLVTDECVSGDPYLTVSPADIVAGPDLYQYDWNTEGAETGEAYRITVLLGDLSLGYADVYLAQNGGEAKRSSGDLIGLVNGRTLPIKFHISAGVLLPDDLDTDDYYEGAVPATGATVTTSTQHAGAYFPSGWFDAEALGVDEVHVVIYRRDIDPGTGEQCIFDTPLVEWEGCYVFETEPHVGGADLLEDLTVGVCLDPEAELSDPRHEDGQLGALHGDGSFELLDNTPAAFLDCADFVAAAEPDGLLGRLAGTLTRPLTWLLGQPAYATHLGDGGIVKRGSVGFSDIGWVWPVEVALADGYTLPATVPAGTTIDVELKLYTEHSGAPEPIGAGESLELVFGGTGPQTSFAGFAFGATGPTYTYSWSLDSAAGEYTLTVGGEVLEPLELTVVAGPQIASVSPSALSVPSAGPMTGTFVLEGAGFTGGEVFTTAPLLLTGDAVESGAGTRISRDFEIGPGATPGDYEMIVRVPTSLGILEDRIPVSIVPGGIAIDGQAPAGEWDNASCHTFTVTRADGITTDVPGSFCYTYDQNNIYVKLEASTFDPARAGVQFDLDNDGTLTPDATDDVLILRAPSFTQVEYDGFYVAGGHALCPTYDPDSPRCLVGDGDLGGESNGTGAMGFSHGSWTAEFSHPFCSGDTVGPPGAQYSPDICVQVGGSIDVQGRWIFGDHWSHANVVTITRPDWGS